VVVQALDASEKRTLALLGLPTAALALAITVVTTYVPVAASEFLDSSVVIGGLIAIAARAQSTQAIWRGTGTGIALIGGGLLIAWGTAAPFAFSAILFAVAMGGFLLVAIPRARERGESRGSEAETVMEEASSLGSVVRGHPELRAYLVANALWEASLGALKTFVFLYITIGLGRSQSASAAIVGGVALLVLPAAVLSGKLADRYGRLRAMTWVLPVYGVGQLIPAFTESIAILIPVMVIVGFGGGLVMTLPYALLQPLMPPGRHGTVTGFYSLSLGIGTALGPAIAAGASHARARAPSTRRRERPSTSCQASGSSRSARSPRRERPSPW
jgi:Na+/melibiose symporter-like transporter